MTNMGSIAMYLWTVTMRLFNSIIINQTEGGLMSSLTPKCKHYISGFIARSLVNKLNEEDKNMLRYSGRFVNELGFYKSCTSTSNMAYYLIQAGADIVRVNLGVCFTQQCSPQDVQIFQNYMFTKLKEKISEPTNYLYKARDYLVFNVQQVEVLAKSVFSDPLMVAFYGILLFGLITVVLATLWRKLQRRSKKSEQDSREMKAKSFLDTSDEEVVSGNKSTQTTKPQIQFSQDSYNSTSGLELVDCFDLQYNWRCITGYKLESAEQLTIDFLRSLSYVGVLEMNIAYIEAEISKIGVDTTTRNYYVHGFKHTALQGSLLVPDLFLMLGGYTATLAVLRKIG